MSYQPHFSSSTVRSKAVSKMDAQKCRAKKSATLSLVALPLVAVLGVSTLLSGCGFQLRGYEAPLHFNVAKTAIIIDDNRTSFPLKLPLTQRLESLGVTIVNGSSALDDTAEPIATINVNNVRFKRYELVGVLTEIRLVLSADVTYQTLQDGKPVTLTNPVQVERSYQYNEAAVSTDDQQGSQIRDWLYDSLARRISDQYVAINLPKVSPARTGKSSNLITTPANQSSVTTVVTPDS